MLNDWGLPRDRLKPSGKKMGLRLTGQAFVHPEVPTLRTLSRLTSLWNYRERSPDQGRAQYEHPALNDTSANTEFDLPPRICISSREILPHLDIFKHSITPTYYEMGLCHCGDCRKITGTLYTYSFVVKRNDLHVSGAGTPKEIAKTASSGNYIKNFFCPDCGTPLFGWRANADGEPADSIVIVRVGIFDDAEIFKKYKPQAELFAAQRAEWVGEIEGAEQFTAMMPIHGRE
ncbi:GFA family protein [Aspergillus lucknowensis]|uniref:Mss4-like protein n=1 Tax=Aspergillus lucknowensis TaxID=176173 RepID=A0ABR4LRR7_9EURO